MDQVISTSAAAAEGVQQSSTLILADAAAAAIGAIGQKPMLASLLHTPTLWSVLAMTSIVALLVAWEESIE